MPNDRTTAALDALLACIARMDEPVDGPEVDPAWLEPDAPCQGPDAPYEEPAPIAGEIVVPETLEILVHGSWLRVGPYVFRSWAGKRRRNGEDYVGPVYLLGTDRVFERPR